MSFVYCDGHDVSAKACIRHTIHDSLETLRVMHSNVSRQGSHAQSVITSQGTDCLYGAINSVVTLISLL